MVASRVSVSVDAKVDGEGRAFAFSMRDEAGRVRVHHEAIPGATQQDYLDLFERLAPRLGTRLPRNRQTRTLPAPVTPHQPLLTRNLSPEILYGYGDPSVLWVPEEQAWYMVVTSNDAPNSFPILRTADLTAWELAGFVFPQGRKPAWAMDGPGSDYWAAELHKVGPEYLLCFAAREHDGSMSLGLAHATSPAGPFSLPEQPLLRGGVIDGHLFVERDGGVLLLWKEDSNADWPRLLVKMLGGDHALVGRLFDSAEDRRTAALLAGLWRWAVSRGPMEQFFLLQPLIEAVVDRFAEVRACLAALGTIEAAAVLGAMRTPIYAQPLTAGGSALIGQRRQLLVNDLPWEGHLIEGPWLTEQGGRYYLFYAGNDFSTDEYGIGVAIGESPLGPFRKAAMPLIRSDAQWTGPGHPSVAPGCDRRPQLFYHAFEPGHAGYKAFRALLKVPLLFRNGRVEVGLS